MTDMRALIEDCCGWNKKTWADAVAFAIALLPDDLHGKQALEIGASESSTLIPILAAKGAEAFCSYYEKSPGAIENGRLKYICNKYHIHPIPVFEADVININGRYDIIIMKSILGGVQHRDDNNSEGISRILRKIIADNLLQNGTIITLDNGYIKAFEMLRRCLGAGRHGWNYLRSGELEASLSGADVTTEGFGFLTIGPVSRLVGVSCEPVNNLLYFVDKLVLRVFNPAERAVLATVIRPARA